METGRGMKTGGGEGRGIEEKQENEGTGRCEKRTVAEQRNERERGRKESKYNYEVLPRSNMQLGFCHEKRIKQIDWSNILTSNDVLKRKCTIINFYFKMCSMWPPFCYITHLRRRYRSLMLL